jgi:molybdate transport system ATP-binding protein
VLEVRLHKRLASITLDVAFDIGAETLVLFGPSGAGKSLTLQMIAGVVAPDAGRVRVGERVLLDTSTRARVPPQARRVGMVPQHYALFPHMTALDNITFPLRKGRGWSRVRAERRATELLRSFGLQERARARPAELSGGQQQRVALARALAAEPELLLLDEPFAALDAPIRLELRDELRAVRRQLGIPMLFVTHDLEEAAMLADRLAVMVDGHVRQIDTTRAVLDHPADRAVAELVQARNIIAGQVERRGDDPVVMTSAGMLLTSTPWQHPGAAVYAIVRPEAIRVVRDDRPLDPLGFDNLVTGQVVEIVDHGTRCVLHVLVGDLPLEVSLSPVETARRRIRPGAQVRLSIPPASIHVVPAEPDDSGRPP